MLKFQILTDSPRLTSTGKAFKTADTAHRQTTQSVRSEDRSELLPSLTNRPSLGIKTTSNSAPIDSHT